MHPVLEGFSGGIPVDQPCGRFKGKDISVSAEWLGAEWVKGEGRRMLAEFKAECGRLPFANLRRRGKVRGRAYEIAA